MVVPADPGVSVAQAPCRRAECESSDVSVVAGFDEIADLAAAQWAGALISLSLPLGAFQSSRLQTCQRATRNLRVGFNGGVNPSDDLGVEFLTAYDHAPLLSPDTHGVQQKVMGQGQFLLPAEWRVVVPKTQSTRLSLPCEAVVITNLLENSIILEGLQRRSVLLPDLRFPVLRVLSVPWNRSAQMFV